MWYLSVAKICWKTGCLTSLLLDSILPVRPGTPGQKPFRPLSAFSVLSGSVGVQPWALRLHRLSLRRGVSVFDHFLSSRNNGLIFWTETYNDSSIPCQWGALSGLRIQQEADDEPVRSLLKCPGETRSKSRHVTTTAHLRVSRSTRPTGNYFGFIGVLFFWSSPILL